MTKPNLKWKYRDNTLLLLAMAAKLLDKHKPKRRIVDVEDWNPYVERPVDGAQAIREEINNCDVWKPNMHYYTFEEGLALVSKYVNVILKGEKQ